VLWAALAAVVAGWCTLVVLRRSGYEGPWLPVAALFDLDAEGVIPSWFASALLLIGGACAGIVAALERALFDPRWRGWALISGGFVVMSMDEAVGLHERIGHGIGARVQWFEAAHYAWIVPLAGVVAAAAIALLPFLRALPSPDRRRLLLAGAVFVGGALGVEAITAFWLDAHLRHGVPIAWSPLVMVEELMEFTGAILFIRAVVIYSVTRFDGVTLRAPTDAQR
jgi:hypothetical protein